MRTQMLISTAVLTLALMCVGQPSWAARFNPWRCAPTARAAADNDVRLDDDPRAPAPRVSLPRIVADRIRIATAGVAKHLDDEVTADLTCSELLKPAYRVSGFGRLQLFVAEARFSIAGSHFFLILFDPATGAATERPARIFAKWTEGFGSRDRLLRRPIVSSSDLLGASARQVVFEERVHNGTLYNGVIYHYFEIGPHLELAPRLALETRVLDPADARRPYIRTVRRIGPNRLRLDLYGVAKDGRRSRLGYAIILRSDRGHSFHVASRHLLPGAYPTALVTFCDSSRDDDAFLRNGCDFYY